ncbi:hemerythrin domain-containing protein [Aliiglaciecola sp. CAU 1673]|uniref:hemerythrin domain-containing protein n=1 Tax=Aliiglaciecola sp. CAU 1673 TaxID=3032595 RepID=UPI0023D9F1EA|nr:hemerythrin domain-containing protein [Aliiglaciecola sp. CAU 1673]MDF2177032.1 hemerythrin domain-containing protein [Aliiglaciecola sp. CAU 1673]
MQGFITQFFTSDQQGLELLFIAYLRTKRQDLGISRQFFDKFKVGMRRHIRQKEQLLLPALEGCQNEVELLVQTRYEHQQILQQLTWIEALLDKGMDSEEDDQRLEYLLSDHFENDEFSLYPLCDRKISDEAMGKLLLRLY